MQSRVPNCRRWETKTNKYMSCMQITCKFWCACMYMYIHVCSIYIYIYMYTCTVANGKTSKSAHACVCPSERQIYTALFVGSCMLVIVLLGNTTWEETLSPKIPLHSRLPLEGACEIQNHKTQTEFAWSSSGGAFCCQMGCLIILCVRFFHFFEISLNFL